MNSRLSAAGGAPLRAVCLGAVLVLQACASITSGGVQRIAVNALTDKADPVTAQCDVRNDKGQWVVETPGLINVGQSFQALSINCTSSTHQPGSLVVPSSTKGMLAGNLLVGGMIGAAIDVSSGAAYRYPEVVNVTMGPVVTDPVAASAASSGGASRLLAGSRLTFKVTDQFTRAETVGASVLESPRRPRNGAGHGDMSLLEPPDGWAPSNLVVGQSWKRVYEATDGFPRSQLNLEGRVLRRERVRTSAGTFPVWVVEFSGSALRSAGAAMVQHSVAVTAWIDVDTGQPVRFESNVRGGSGSQAGRTSREVVELIGIEPPAASQ